MFAPSRRTLLLGLAGAVLPACAVPKTASRPQREALDPYRTPFKHPALVLAASGEPGTFDERAVDKPFVFAHADHFLMTYVGFDGEGYQTGLARSDDLVDWQRVGLILGRDEQDPYTRYNIAMDSILRGNDLQGPGRLKRVGGRYLGAWNAYP